MSKIAFVYPGQASQYVGMGSDFYTAFPIARDYYSQAEDILGFALTDISFYGPEETLKQTAFTQPAIFVLSVIITDLLEERGIRPHMAAGHSLGEYSALVAAGVMSFSEALKLVKRRGELMQKAGEISPGTMAAIIGLEEEVLQQICAEATTEGVVQVANYNSPGQIVISGSVGGIHKAIELATGKGAKRAVELVVSGAFHSPLMDHAREELGRALQETGLEGAKIPVYTNVSGKPVQKKEEIRRLLFEQLSCPVLWENSVRAMIDDGADQFFEVGPGKVLAGLHKRIDRTVPITAIGTVEELEKV